jgi:leader peptidase (prepilin peptidase)/N-methyltransferase
LAELTVAAFVLGAIIGSFLNVVICRLPQDLSLSHPPSACPRCGAAIRPWQNIPIVSFLFLKGKCASCANPISWRYPAVEALMGGLSALLWLRYGLTPAFGIYFVFLAALVAITFIDIDHKIIPDSLSLGGIVVGVAASFVLPLGWKGSLIGLGLGAGSLLTVAAAFYAVTRREGMGMGDVKLLGAIGAFLGWEGVVFTIFVSSLVGSVVGIVVQKIFRWRDDPEIPFGPFLALGAAIYVFGGESLVDWYFRQLFW